MNLSLVLLFYCLCNNISERLVYISMFFMGEMLLLPWENISAVATQLKFEKTIICDYK